MSWFLEGSDQSTRDKFIKEAFTPSIMNFWMKEGETREGVFLDDARFGVYEHALPWEGGFKRFTCSGADCVLCGLDKPRSYREYYNFLDLTPFKTKDNKEKKFSLKALNATKDVAKILEGRRADAGGSLASCKFKVSRSGNKSPSCGNDWVFVKKVDLTQVPKDIKLYDFREVLRPVPADKIRAMLNSTIGGSGGVAAVSRDSLTGPAGNIDQTAGASLGEEDIPF